MAIAGIIAITLLLHSEGLYTWKGEGNKEAVAFEESEESSQRNVEYKQDEVHYYLTQLPNGHGNFLIWMMPATPFPSAESGSTITTAC